MVAEFNYNESNETSQHLFEHALVFNLKWVPSYAGILRARLKVLVATGGSSL